ncbi:MAG: hypothetical protein ACKOSQ_02165 [Planctomycetaceae bacterium]
MPIDPKTLDDAFTALAAYDWGKDAGPLAPLDAAVVAAHGDPALRADLEKRLAALLGTGASRAAKDQACRRLSLVATAASVPAAAALLSDADNSHMGRFVLERIGGPEACAALRKALETTKGALKLGMISSLADLRDAEAVKPLAGLLGGEEPVAVAAARGLGRIGTPEALAALVAAAPSAAAGVGPAIADSRLTCAETLLAAGNRTEAKAAYQALVEAVRGKPESKAVAMAATRGVLACADPSAAAN